MGTKITTPARETGKVAERELRVAVTCESNSMIVRDFLAEVWRSWTVDPELAAKSQNYGGQPPLMDGAVPGLMRLFLGIGVVDVVDDQRMGVLTPLFRKSNPRIVPPRLVGTRQVEVYDLHGRRTQRAMTEREEEEFAPMEFYLTLSEDSLESNRFTQESTNFGYCHAAIVLYDSSPRYTGAEDYFQSRSRFDELTRGLASISNRMLRYDLNQQPVPFLVVGVDSKTPTRNLFVRLEKDKHRNQQNDLTILSPSCLFPFTFDVDPERQSSWLDVVKRYGTRLYLDLPTEIALGTPKERKKEWSDPRQVVPRFCSDKRFAPVDLRHCHFVTFVLLSFSKQQQTPMQFLFPEDGENQKVAEPLHIPKEMTRHILIFFHLIMGEFKMPSLIAFLVGELIRPNS